jgi:hypothetical protein
MAVILPGAGAADLVGLAWILAAVVLGALKLLRVRHDWDFGDMSGLTVGVVAGVIFVLPIYIGLFLIAYDGLCSLFPALPTVHLPWWSPARGG